MVHCNSARELVDALQEIAAKVGKRFVLDTAPITQHELLGPPDSEAWFDVRIGGITKLNCFLSVTQATYNAMKKAPWAPPSGKRVSTPPQHIGGRWTKGADGIVIANGPAGVAAMEVLGQLGGSNPADEHFEAALYENLLYKPVLCNLELKLLSNAVTPEGRPAQSLIINAHIEPRPA